MADGGLNPFDGLEDEEDGEVEGVREIVDIPLHERPPEEQVEYHWNAMAEIMKSSVSDPFVLEELKEHLKAIEKFVIKERPETSGRTGDCLEFLLSENVVENVYLFSTRQRVYGKEVRVMLLKFFTEVFARSVQPILIHQQILRPLSRLLRACEGIREHEIANALVPLLHQICILMQENQSLLDLFFIDSPVHLQSKFLIFTQLIPYMHETSEMGNRARDALLLCLSLAAQLPASNLSKFITVDCNFCQVLATGLSALYSELPTSREITVEEWQSPLPVIDAAVPELRKFTQALSFCNSVLQMAPKEVCDTVLSLVREGFLQQVLGPALFQSSEDAVMFTTAYLTLFLTHISNVSLMREFLRYITLGQVDGRRVLNTLTINISSSNNKLCSVTLELFYVLVDLNCEDVMLELIFKHLLPGQHVMPNQLAIISSPDIYGQAARRFLQLLPTACINAEKMFLQSIKPSPQPSPEASRANSPPPPPLLTTSPSYVNQLDKPTPVHSSILKPTVANSNTNPFNAIFHSRSRSGSNGSSSSLTSMSSSSSAPQTGNTGSSNLFNGGTSVRSHAPTLSPIGSYQFQYIPPEVAYLDNLEAAREAIYSCTIRCKCWSNSYDKCEVSKKNLVENLNSEPKQAAKALEMEDVHVRVHVTGENDDEFENLGRFRSRAVTLSHTKLSRATSLKVHSHLNPGGVLEDRKTVSRDNGTEHAPSQDSLLHVGSVSGRISPKLGRRASDESKSRFEDRTGLLLKILLEKLSEMLQLPPVVNVVLTRLISRLAHYPHPLLRSLLLNHQLVLKPGVPNLLSVLQTIKARVDGYARTQDGFEKRLGRARKTMIYRAHVRNTQLEASVAQQIVSRLMRQSSKASELGETQDKELPSPLKKRGSKANVDTSEDPLPNPRQMVHTGEAKSLAKKRRRKKVTTDTLFAIVIFDELLRELSALSQEHSVLNPTLYLPKSIFLQ